MAFETNHPNDLKSGHEFGMIPKRIIHDLNSGHGFDNLCCCDIIKIRKVDTSMKKAYTKEQMDAFAQNCFTYAICPSKITFTLEFKQYFLSQIREHGKTTDEALRAAGYDPMLFSTAGKNSLRRRILDEARSEQGLRPPRGLSQEERIAAFEAKDLSRQRSETSIKELQERIVYLEKQIEFLKKISNIANR